MAEPSSKTDLAMLMDSVTYMHLVVLDDDEPIAQFMATVAGARGWDARAVTHEAEFQALIRAGQPDAIILDLQLGASDGIEQLRSCTASAITAPSC